jgi:IclR family transcriptional regulator, pca regulon regulatory protein
VTKEGLEDRWQERLLSFGDPRMSQSLEIGLLALQTFAPERPFMGIADIADRLHMARSTVHRYVVTLQACGFLEQTEGRKYRLATGTQKVGMSMLNATGLPSVSLPFLRSLRDQVGHTVSLAILDRDCILYVVRVYSHGRGQYTADEGRRMGSRVPASCTAMGKALIAGLPTADEREWTQETTLRSCGPNAIVRKVQFQAELERVRQRGYAANNQELLPNMVAIAAPVQKGYDVSAAMGIAANANMMRSATLVARCRDALLATASELAEHLDYNPRNEVTQHMTSLLECAAPLPDTKASIAALGSS